MNKDLIIKVLYVIVWSLGLMFATFPNLISGEMKFDFQNNLNNDAVMKYIFPFIMAMAIYLLMCFMCQWPRSGVAIIKG